jgi:membrane protein DedA with SNARE-associated domain
MWKTLAAGAVISVPCFVLLLWGVGHVLVLLPRVQGSVWFHPAMNAITVFSVAAGLLIYRRQQRRVKKAAHRPACS